MKQKLFSFDKGIILFLLISISQVKAQWVTNGPFGGPINVVKTVGSTMYAGTGNGVFRSADNGQTWSAANSGMARKGTHALAVAGNTIYAGTDYDGVYYSTNDGANWSAKNTGLNNLNIISLFSSTAGMFVSNSNGIYFSSGGAWTSANNGIPSNYPIYTFAQMGDTVFGGTYGLGLYFTTNNGGSWVQAGGGFPANTFVYALITDGNNIYAGTSAGVYKSGNRGVSWSQSNNGFPPSMWAKSFTVKPGYILAGTYSEGVFVSTNNGNSWTAMNNGIPNLPFPTGLPHNYPSVEALDWSGANIVAATANGMYLTSTNGSQWSESNQGILGTDITATATKGSMLFVGAARVGVYASPDNGATWQRTNNGLTSYDVIAITANTTAIMVSVSIQKAFRSVDNGATWYQASNGLPTPPAILKSDNNRFLTITQGAQYTAPGLFETTNSGANWTQLSTNGISGMTALGMQGSLIYIGTFNGKIYKTNNNGANWQDMSMNLPVIKINTILQVDTFLFAGTDGQNIYKTSINGTSWSTVGTGVNNNTITDIQMQNSALYASTWGGGVFTSNLQGSSWGAINTGLSNLFVRNLASSPSGVFAGTDAGAYSYSLSVSGIKKEEIKSELVLYPNPTTGRIYITGVKEKMDVTLYNSFGSLIYAGMLSNNEIDFSDFPKGIYMLNLNSEGMKITRNIVVQ
ncbi:MAG: T9SS type A sorting domain-containing protein [Mucilaginibacter sp.]